MSRGNATGVLRQGNMVIVSIYDGDDAGRSRIKFFLTRPEWSLHEVAALFNNFDPDLVQFAANRSGFVAVTMLTGEKLSADTAECEDEIDGPYYAEDEPAIDRLHELFLDYLECSRALGGAGYARQIASPREWVRLAQLADIHIPWLEWAVRRKFLELECLERIADAATAQGALNRQWSRNDYFLTIGAFLDLMLKKTIEHEQRYTTLSSQDGVIDAIHGRFGRESFLSPSSLEKCFATANKAVKGKYATDKPVARKSHTHYTIVIGALIHIMLVKNNAGIGTHFGSEEALIAAMQAHFPSAPFLAPEDLQKLFAEATRRISEL
jgi:hypothetical protein